MGYSVGVQPGGRSMRISRRGMIGLAVPFLAAAGPMAPGGMSPGGMAPGSMSPGGGMQGGGMGAMGGMAMTVPPASADTVQIYAAMTVRAAVDAVLHAYTGGPAVGVYGPTPLLVRQLDNGAPADILLTADPDWMDDAAKRGLIQPDSRVDLLRNTLVLAGPAGTPAVGEIGRGFGLEALLAGGRLAMCDPGSDPAGRYAKQSLMALGLWDRVAPHIAVAETSLAAVTLLERGEARAAICFATDLGQATRVATVGTFAEASHAPIVYPAALARHAPHATAAATLAFLRAPAAGAIFTRFGYRATT